LPDLHREILNMKAILKEHDKKWDFQVKDFIKKISNLEKKGTFSSKTFHPNVGGGVDGGEPAFLDSSSDEVRDWMMPPDSMRVLSPLARGALQKFYSEFEAIQKPVDGCLNKKFLVCKLPGGCGFGCQLHALIPCISHHTIRKEF